MSYPTGKGILIWDINACSAGIPEVISSKAKASGFSWVAIKVTDGSIPFAPYKQQSTYPSLLEDTITASQGLGIAVWGWGYIYGISDLHAQSEAFAAAAAVNRHTLAGFLIDAENQFKQPGAFRWATNYMDTLRRERPTIPLGLCSYRFPS